MSKHVILRVRAISAGLTATVIMLGANCATLAAEDCLAGPNRPPAQGGHWYYRVDHANNRKCWYLVEPGAQTSTAEAREPQPPFDATPQPTFGAFLSSLSAGLSGATAASQPDPTIGDARVMQAAHPDNLKNDETGPGRRTRVARPPNAQAALAPKQHRPARPRTPAEHADERPAPPLKETERDALFEEFLRWKGRQTP